MTNKAILFDLRDAQRNRERGIPKYIQSLVLRICQSRPSWNFYFLYEKEMPEPLQNVELKRCGSFVSVQELEVLLNHSDAYITDFFITSFFLERLTKEVSTTEYLVPRCLLRSKPRIFGILYDFIPMLYPEIYLNHYESRVSYALALEMVKVVQHLFAISKCTKHDAEKLLGISPNKITTIYGGIDENLWRNASIDKTNVQDVLPDCKKQSYFLYVGGDDWRKNIGRLLDAFKLFLIEYPHLKNYKLVICCSMIPERKQMWQDTVLSKGLSLDSHVIFTGYLSDQELITLCSNARATVFPSLYEGLGLPVLESYACAVPVIGSNSSAICELVHERCLFDPTDSLSIAKKMADIIVDPSLREVSVAFGEKVLSEVNWDTTTSKVLHVLESEDMCKNEVKQSKYYATVTCLPPEESGVAKFSWKTLKNANWINHFFCTNTKKTSLLDLQLCERSPSKFDVFNNILFCSTSLNRAIALFDYKSITFVLGNSKHHVKTLKSLLLLAKKKPGIQRNIHLHEAQLTGLWLSYFDFNLDELKKFFETYYSDKKVEIRACDSFEDLLKLKLYGLKPLLALANPEKFILNSLHCKTLIENEVENFKVDYEVLFLPVCPPPQLEKKQLFTGTEEAQIGHFGVLDVNKHPEILIEACKILSKQTPLKLHLVGYNATEYYKAKKLSKYNFITAQSCDNELEYYKLMNSLDLAVQLRWPNEGETSGVVTELISLNKPTIVTETGTFTDFKSSVISTRPNITPLELANIIAHTLSQIKENTIDFTYAETKLSLKRYQEKLAILM